MTFATCLQDESTDSSAPSPPAKGMRGIMQRALQQARADAAAQAQGTPGSAPGDDEASAANPGPPTGSTVPASQSTPKDKKTLGAMLRKAAQKMQQEARTDDAAHQDLQETVEHMSRDKADHGHDSPLDPASITLERQGTEPSATSHTGLLLPELSPDLQQHKAPSRGPSLGEKLGSLLRNALSIPRQPSYVPVDSDDAAVEAALGAAGQLAPGSQRALPRDASYLPEWLNRTLRRESMLGRSSSSARSSAEFSRTSNASRAESALPEWVDVADLQSPAAADTDSHGAGPSQTAQQEPGQQESAPAEQPPFGKPLRAAVRSAPAPEPPVALISAPSWPPTEAAPASKESRGKRLLAFWQQAAAAATAPAMSQPTAAPAAGHMTGVSQVVARAVRAHAKFTSASDLPQPEGLSQGLQFKGPGMPFTVAQLVTYHDPSGLVCDPCAMCSHYCNAIS